ncbi:hypothetical protein [Microcoleus sp. CAWBG58]|uniref:hypothetical protein n=1 Tax=Microcoleus sp. CAWBG58 TaxID=2841651 RepID=UPI00260039AB|nr:hypothetical protein [Microcoleus sp. CAWBG58]
MKAGAPGEIKIRLFITPILGLPGRGRPLAVNCQLSTVNCQLSTYRCVRASLCRS